MIIQKHFAEKYLKSEVFEENIFFSGDILNYYYDKKGKFLGKEYYWRKPLPKDRIESKTGGLFCIKQSVFRKYNGMKNYYRRTQDNEFGLRLASKGIKMLRFKELFVIHQTISYTNYYRLVKIILNGDFFYRGLLYREQILNKEILSTLIKTDYSMLALGTSLFLFLVTKNTLMFLIYFVLLILRSFRSFLAYKENFFLYLIYTLSRDLQTLLGFFLFFPKKLKRIKYKITSTIKS